MKKIDIVRLYNDKEGESHYSEITYEFMDANFAPPAPSLGISITVNTKKSFFLHLPKGYYGDFHPAPNRQIMVVIKGGIESVASDGEVRRFEVGDIALVEDTFGKGHSTKSEDVDTIVYVVQI